MRAALVARMPLPRTPLSLFASLAAASCAAEPSTVRTDVQALIGGEDVVFAPGEVTTETVQLHVIRTDGTGRGCTASRIGPRHFLTAAHCLENLDYDKPIDILGGSPATLIASASLHTPLTVAQESVLIPDLVSPDVAVITIDARRDGYHDLEDVQAVTTEGTLADGHAVWEMLRDPNLAQYAQAVHVGYGCDELTLDNQNPHGQGTMRWGVAPAIEWPAIAPWNVDTNDYFFTRGHDIDRKGTASLDDDERVGEGISLCPGDSGGPVYFGSGIAGVNARWLGDVPLTHVVNFVSIPDLGFVDGVRAAPVIDVVAKQEADLDPQLERDGRLVELYPDVPGHDAFFVKGYRLEGATFLAGDQLLPIKDFQVVDRTNDVETVKITIDPTATTMGGVLKAFVPSQPGQDTLVSSAKTTIQIHAPRVAWKRYQIYRAEPCLGAGCPSVSPGLVPITVRRWTRFETTVADEPVRLEHLESVGHTLGWDPTGIDNEDPRLPSTAGHYQFVTYSCNPNGSGCATIYIDFEYQDEESVEQLGTQCRYRTHRAYGVVPWVYVLGEKFVLTELLEGMLTDLGVSDGFILGDPEIVDGEPAHCDAIAQAHPMAPPFEVAANGAIIPHTGWEPVE
jgi:hypothetical protein